MNYFKKLNCYILKLRLKKLKIDEILENWFILMALITLNINKYICERSYLHKIFKNIDRDI